MSEVSEILLMLGEALVNDEDIKQFCQDNFGRDQTVFVGMNNEDTPADDEYPLIVIFYAERVVGDSSNINCFASEIGAGVRNKNLEETGKLKVYTGMIQVEDLREIIETAIFAYRLKHPREFGKINVSGDTRSETYYPIFRSNTLITIEKIRTSRKPIGKKKGG